MFTSDLCVNTVGHTTQLSVILYHRWELYHFFKDCVQYFEILPNAVSLISLEALSHVISLNK